MFVRSLFKGRGSVVFDGGGPPPETGLIPMTFDSSLFTGMSESSSVITLTPGQNATKRSIVETSGAPSISLDGDNILTLSRVDSRECVRIQNGTNDEILIDQCFFESLGVGDDHADTIQAYTPGSRGGTVTITNTHIVAHTTAATAGYFTADDWGGTIVLENVIFNGGPYGLWIYIDPGCHIDIYLKDVFFVAPFGNGPLLIENVGNGTHTIHQWENVCEATIVDDELIPGDPISNPG